MHATERLPSFRLLSFLCALACGLFQLVGTVWFAADALQPEWLFVAWLGLTWAIVFNTITVAFAPLTLGRLVAGLLVLVWCGYSMASVTDRPLARYLLSYSGFTLLVVGTQWMLALPPWHLLQTKALRPRRMTILGLLAMTALCALLMAAVRQQPEASFHWLPLFTTMIALLIVLNLARMSVVLGEDRVIFGLFWGFAVFAAPALFVGMRRTATDVDVYGGPLARDALWPIYVHTLIVFATAGILTLLFHLCGRMDARATGRVPSSIDSTPAE